jgi:hypothetical protein
MFTPLVRFLLSDGRIAAVPAGGLLGRLATAALRFDDARVSEAHALVSLRGESLWLLGLRGPIEVDGAVVRDAPLARGARIRLAEGVLVSVESIELPGEVLVLDLPEGPAPLRGEVMSLVDAGRPMLVSRFVEDAQLRVWTSGIGWRGQAAGGRAFDVRPGAEVSVAGRRLRFRAVAPSALAAQATSGVGLRVPLTVRTTLEELRISALDRPTLFVGGVPARIVRELADYAEPVPWVQVAVAVLGFDDEVGLRMRWDRNLKTLRRKLEEHGYRSDIVRPDRRGNVSLGLDSQDRLEIV